MTNSGHSAIDRPQTTRRKVSRLLGADIINPFISSEEQRHSWSVKIFQKLDRPLLRIWDSWSGSQPDGHNRCRNHLISFLTQSKLVNTLTIHLDNKKWLPTAYISFTTSASAIKDLATSRIDRRRGVQTLTVINPAARLSNGLPLLNVAAEMEYYRIPDPYNSGSRYYIDHYVCLWEVTEEEIVDHYKWEELAKTTNWYEDVIMPAFRKSSRRKKSNSTSTRASAFDMSTMMESLPSKSLAHIGIYVAYH
jgi:hypothetical protein